MQRVSAYAVYHDQMYLMQVSIDKRLKIQVMLTFPQLHWWESMQPAAYSISNDLNRI